MQIYRCAPQFPLSIISKTGFCCQYRILEWWILKYRRIYVVAGSHVLLITVHVKKGQGDLNEHYA